MTSILLRVCFLTLLTASFVSHAVADDLPGIALPATDDGLPGAGPIRRYDWFQGLWNERRSAWAKRIEQDQKAVVFLGDSITQGWGDDLHGSFPGMRLPIEASAATPLEAC